VADLDRSELRGILHTLLAEVQELQIGLAVLSKAHFSAATATLDDLQKTQAGAHAAVYERTKELVRRIEAL
jgi:hypothetical protein